MSSYHVLFGPKASGIYNTIEDVNKKVQLRYGPDDEVEILARTKSFSSLNDAFSALQQFRSSGSIPYDAKYCGNTSVKTDQSASQEPLSRTQCFVQRDSNHNEHDLLSTPLPKQEPRNTETCSIPVKKAGTRNVCIQANRLGSLLNAKKAQPHVLKIDCSSQCVEPMKKQLSHSSTQTKDVIVSSHEDISNNFSTLHVSPVTFENLFSVNHACLQNLESKEIIRHYETLKECKSRDWFLRHDWFKLSVYLPNSRNRHMKSSSGEINGSDSRKRKLTGSTGADMKFKIPKIPSNSVIGKRQKNLKKNNTSCKKDKLQEICEDEEVEEEMNCTQARIDDRTHSVRDIPHGCVGVDYESIFSDYLSKSVSHIIVEDSYIQKPHQIQNLTRFIEVLLKRTTLKRLDLVTCQNHEKATDQMRMLEEIRCALEARKINFNYRFDSKLHDRVVKFNNGWSVSLGRGLDYFLKPVDLFNKFDFTTRPTKAFRVMTYKSDKF